MLSTTELGLSVLDAIADAIVLIDEQGNIELFNRAASEIFGYAPEEVLGRNVKVLMPEPVSSQHDLYLRRYQETSIPHIIGVGRDVEGRHKDGRVLALWLRIGELRTPDGRRRFIGSMRDIAERRRLEEELRNANTRMVAEIEDRKKIELELLQHKHELERHTVELEYSRTSLEQVAQQTVELAEGLELQRQELTLAKQHSDYLASHDTLTGLLNRRAFMETLNLAANSALRTNTLMAVMFIDLDKFKGVNDLAGHARGDELLKTVAGILTTNLRDTDIAGRLGGDEFAVVSNLATKSDPESFRRLAERLRQSLSLPVKTDYGVVDVRATIGVAIYPTDATDMDELLTCADRAMYAGKNRGRDVVVFYAEVGALA
ncbi:MAG: diguanylate cyclase [Rhodospirillaceae bacterium]|nr:diguanylate cyclase [Rhodospirillaceae bacterium]